MGLHAVNEIDPELFNYHFGDKPSIKDVEMKLNTRVSGAYVLSIDICSYSAFVRATPELEVATTMLRDFCDRGRKTVIDSGGAIDRVTGDSVMAFWGLLEEVDHRVPLDAGFRLLFFLPAYITRSPLVYSSDCCSPLSRETGSNGRAAA